MSIINLLKNDIWSESDIVNHGRAVINSHVSQDRQNELRTIMLGHIAGMRTATPEEMAEIVLVQQVTEQQVADNAAARADMALLQSVLDYEAAVERLTCDPITEPLTVTRIIDDVACEVPNPAIAQDAAERAEAQAVIDAATPEVLALYALRHPPEPTPEPEIVE